MTDKAKRAAIKTVLTLGALTTIATSAPPIYIRDAGLELTLQPDTPVHVTLRISEDVVDDADEIDLRLDPANPNASGYAIQLTPDLATLPVVEIRPGAPFQALGALQDHCQRVGVCTLGFTVELLAADDGQLDVVLYGQAQRSDAGLCGNNGDFRDDGFVRFEVDAL